MAVTIGIDGVLDKRESLDSILHHSSQSIVRPYSSMRDNVDCLY